MSSPSIVIGVSPIYNTPSFELIPNVVSVDFLFEAYCCKYAVASSPNFKVLTDSTGSSYACIEGCCGNCMAFIEDDIDAGSAFRALDVAAEFSLIVDNNAFCSFDIADCESTIGLYNFTNSRCIPISPNFSDRKF